MGKTEGGMRAVLLALVLCTCGCVVSAEHDVEELSADVEGSFLTEMESDLDANSGEALMESLGTAKKGKEKNTAKKRKEKKQHEAVKGALNSQTKMKTMVKDITGEQNTHKGGVPVHAAHKAETGASTSKSKAKSKAKAPAKAKKIVKAHEPEIKVVQVASKDSKQATHEAMQRAEKTKRALAKAVEDITGTPMIPKPKKNAAKKVTKKQLKKAAKRAKFVESKMLAVDIATKKAKQKAIKKTAKTSKRAERHAKMLKKEAALKISKIHAQRAVQAWKAELKEEQQKAYMKEHKQTLKLQAVHKKAQQEVEKAKRHAAVLLAAAKKQENALVL